MNGAYHCLIRLFFEYSREDVLKAVLSSISDKYE